jgi:hypothetical protein
MEFSQFMLQSVGKAWLKIVCKFCLGVFENACDFFFENLENIFDKKR